jgi:hypothetical protein
VAHSQTPAKDIALLALQADPSAPTAMLRAVIVYAFDQLCWRMNDTELHGMLDSLRDELNAA